MSKLYTATTDEFALPVYAERGVPKLAPADNIPMVFWPDGEVCWIANLYLLKGYRRGRSRSNKGGTLLTWAKNLSPLIRWCYTNRVDFIDLTDSHFKAFVSTLETEISSKNPGTMARSTQQVVNICSTVLSFLEFVDERLPGRNLIGPHGKIRAEKKTFQIRTRGERGTISTTVWVHDCVPSPVKARRRQPISTSAVDRLYEANASLMAPAFIARRRFIMLRLLEITGGRRIEISRIRVQDVKKSLSTGDLRLFSAKKRRSDVFRFVPISRSDVVEILSYVNHYRRILIRKTIGFDNDHDLLFINSESGMPLEIDTLGSEMKILRQAAGIDDEEACMHAFRHRFITNIFRDLINTHHYKDKDDLRSALLSTETLKRKVMEWTGHSSIESLDVYIHLAFEAEANFSGTIDVIGAARVIESLRKTLEEYGRRLRPVGPASRMYVGLLDIVTASELELASLLRYSKVAVH